MQMSSKKKLLQEVRTYETYLFDYRSCRAFSISNHKKLHNQDCSIRGLILPDEQGTDDEQITYYRGDITKPDTLDAFFSGLEEYEVIVLHMAGIISIQDKVSPLVYEVNVNGTKNVVDKCLQYHVARLLYASSVHVIPEPDKITTIEEILKRRFYSPLLFYQ